MPFLSPLFPTRKKNFLSSLFFAGGSKVGKVSVVHRPAKTRTAANPPFFCLRTLFSWKLQWVAFFYKTVDVDGGGLFLAFTVRRHPPPLPSPFFSQVKTEEHRYYCEKKEAGLGFTKYIFQKKPNRNFKTVFSLYDVSKLSVTYFFCCLSNPTLFSVFFFALFFRARDKGGEEET